MVAAQEKPAAGSKPAAAATNSTSSGFLSFLDQIAHTNASSGWTGHLLIRNGWIDLFDNGLAGNADTTAGKAQGATFSYSHDGSSGHDSWSAVGAVGYVISSVPKYRTSDEGLHFGGWTAAPVVAVNKVQAAATNSVDHLYFALPLSASWLYSKEEALLDPHNFVANVQLRAGFVYDTDTSFHARLPGGIFEFEPQFLWTSGSHDSAFPWLSLGWNNFIGDLEHGKRAVKFQVRTWLHLEGGDIQESGTTWNVVKGSFLRIGPEVRGQVAIPALNGLSISAEYDYLPTVSGPAGKNYLYKFNGSLPLIGNPSSATEASGTAAKALTSLALTVDYSKGGLILSKQPVDLLTVGLSILY
jgi:hypothetical protein